MLSVAGFLDGAAPRPYLPAHTAHRACQVCDFVAAVGVTAQPEAVTMLHNAAGEAFITLESKSQETEVLKANRQQVGKRYVEVFSSSAAEKQAGSPPPEPYPSPSPSPNPDPDPDPDPTPNPDPNPAPTPAPPLNPSTKP